MEDSNDSNNDVFEVLKETSGRSKQHHAAGHESDYSQQYDSDNDQASIKARKESTGFFCGEDGEDNGNACNSSGEQSKIDLRIQPTEMCILASEMKEVEGIDRMQPVASFLHD